MKCSKLSAQRKQALKKSASRSEHAIKAVSKWLLDQQCNEQEIK